MDNFVIGYNVMIHLNFQNINSDTVTSSSITVHSLVNFSVK